MRIFLFIIFILLPWSIRRRLLVLAFGFEIHPTAYIGFSLILPRFLKMSEYARIGHLVTAVHLDEIFMGASSSIDRGCWITGFPASPESKHFCHQINRVSRLSIGRHSAITKNHHFDCTSPIEIGEFTTIAGYQSQFLTHSIEFKNNRQNSNPIKIGDYCFVGTDVVILGGAVLPSYCILGAKSLLNRSFLEGWSLYAGVPAIQKGPVNRSDKYFSRLTGFVY
jgi:acetyltransferase-like isoleucine patch superfamily enzyme